MKVVIMAGGKGTRISSIASDIPKPMIKIGGVPVLEREIMCLRDQGFDDIIITVGHLSEAITSYFGSGEKIGVKISYYIEKEPLGNAGALLKMKDKLQEDFFLLNGDVIFDIDFNRMLAYHKEKGGLATIFSHPNSHPYDSGLIAVDSNMSVIKWSSKEDKRDLYYKNRVNAGIHILSPKVLDIKVDSDKVDLDRQLLKPIVNTGKLYAYDSPEYVKDMGTPDRYYLISEDYEKGIIGAKNLTRKQKAIFLDRDGTINKYVGFLKNIDDFSLIEGASEAIKMINRSEYLAIVVTNQPVVARGEVSFDELNEIHNKMETLLGNDGAYVDAIYYCPHHPHSGYEGEIKELKFDCECRKPKAGMLFKAAKDYNIDLKESWIIGDSLTDVECGKNASCKTALIGHKGEADVYGASLNEIVRRILKK